MDLKELFKAEGLSYLGTVDANVSRDAARFEDWMAKKPEWLLTYLEKYPEVRKEPEKIFPGTKSIVLFAFDYKQEDTLRNHGAIAQYARFTDYHRWMRKKAECVAQNFLPANSYRVCVDTAPVLERALAAKTKFGFIGKNTCYIHKEHGSFFLLGELFTSIPLKLDEKELEEEGCGPCTACQTICPTGALKKDYQIEAELCLAYWTIEHRGTIPEKFWPYLKEYYFGCDLCQLACPYNQKTPNTLPLLTRNFPDLFQVATMDQVSYEKYFGGTPMTRAGREGLRRNALIAMHVSGHPRLKEALLTMKEKEKSVLAETVASILTQRLNDSQV